MRTEYNTLTDIIEASILADESEEYTCDIFLTNPQDPSFKPWESYSVSVSNRDLVFYCTEGIIQYLVDIYNGKPVAVLHDYSIGEIDDEEIFNKDDVE